jgi:hypothetical protein
MQNPFPIQCSFFSTGALPVSRPVFFSSSGLAAVRVGVISRRVVVRVLPALRRSRHGVHYFTTVCAWIHHGNLTPYLCDTHPKIMGISCIDYVACVCCLCLAGV